MLLLASWTDWLNYPGLELWKFANLLIFTVGAVLILRRPLSTALRARSDSIRLELLRAKKERDEALARLAEADALLGHLEADVGTIQDQARQEAKLERQRLASAAEAEIQKLELQAQREIETTRKVAFKELREFLAQRSVELATESLMRQIQPEDDLRLMNASVSELGRSRG
jgi:F0F1-type ATP synthase membrane subunit b/b'